LANAKDVLHTEKQLMALIPKDKWSRAHHWLIFHGRQVCTARNPACDRCVLAQVCNYRRQQEAEQKNKV
jgi:endonuclease-3